MLKARLAVKILCSVNSINLFGKYFANKTMASSSSAAVTTNIFHDLKQIFQSGVDAVQAKTVLCRKNIQLNECGSTIVCDFNDNRLTLEIADRKRCHLVGFGKAVFGMTDALGKILGDRLKSGIISVPFGTVEKFRAIQLHRSIQVLEGAENNLPDANAESAAVKIVEFVDGLTVDDVLFVLISGGGSALLPLPCAGVSLKEKCDIIKQLAGKGATINDINRVRIDLSATKGGKLAMRAKNAGSIVALIISDIIGDPIELIASGPTVMPSGSSVNESKKILKRYRLWDSLPEHIKRAIDDNAKRVALPKSQNIHNFIIANNNIAVNAALEETKRRNLIGIIISTEINGTVAQLCEAYTRLARYIQMFKRNQIDEHDFHKKILTLQQCLRIRSSFLENIAAVVHRSRNDALPLCLVGGGEPTVEITGNGFGGRNQELALRFSQRGFNDNELLAHDVLLLSAGTDGIDGPTTAAGAIGGAEVVRDFLTLPDRHTNDVDGFIQNNDSFSFYSNLYGGKYHIVTGHTGTNVMDLHLLYFAH